MGKLLSWLFVLGLVAASCGDRTVPGSGGPAKPGGATPAPSGYDYGGY